jgi:hypothetical protein
MKWIEIYKLPHVNTAAGEPVASYKNLAGLSRYAKAHGVKDIAGVLNGGGGFLNIAFKNGAWTHVDFASADVMRNYIHRRRFLWNLKGGDVGNNRIRYKAIG